MFATHPKNRGAGGDILGETDSSGNTLNEYIFFGGKRIALVPGTPAPNGGFEQGLQNWNTWGTGAQVITDPARAHSGNNYLQVSTSTNGGVTSTAMIPVTPGQQITFGGWVYRESGTSGAASWNIVVYWSNQTVDGYLSSGNVTSASWTYQTYTYTIPPGVGYVPLYADIYGASSASTARFDDGFVSFGTAATSGPLFYVEDSLGTSRVITTSTGIVCYDADFYPFGGERPYTNTCQQNYKFEGKERDPETGNDDFGARYYSNRFGRWLSSDWSAVPAPVPYANLTNPQTLNLYSMVVGDPESFADLDGHTFAQTYQVAPGSWGADMMGGTDLWVNNDTGDVAATSDGSPPPGTPQQVNQLGMVSSTEKSTVTNKDGGSTTTTVQTTAQYSLTKNGKEGFPEGHYSQTTTTTETNADGTTKTTTSVKTISYKEAVSVLGRFALLRANDEAMSFNNRNGFEHALNRDLEEHPGYYVSVVAGGAAIPAGAASVVAGAVLGIISVASAIWDKVTGP